MSSPSGRRHPGGTWADLSAGPGWSGGGRGPDDGGFRRSGSGRQVRGSLEKKVGASLTRRSWTVPLLKSLSSKQMAQCHITITLLLHYHTLLLLQFSERIAPAGRKRLLQHYSRLLICLLLPIPVPSWDNNKPKTILSPLSMRTSKLVLCRF